MGLVCSKRGLCWLTGLVASAVVAHAGHAQVDASASIPARAGESPVPIVELAAHEDLVYARSANGRLHRWNTATGDTKVFKQSGFVAIAPDGTVGVTHKKVDPRGSRVDVWELAAERLLRTRVFDNGAGSFSVVNGSVLLVESGPLRPDVPMPMPSIVMPPMVDTMLWEPTTDRLSKGWRFEANSGDGCRFAPVGFRLACADWRGLSWSDLDHPEWGGSIRFAHEWIPPKKSRTKDAPTYPRKPQAELPWTFWESLAWAGDSDHVVLAYARAGGPPECRLERWTSGDRTKAGNGLDRLATVHGRCSIKVLAASRDGEGVVTIEDGRLVLRRAPKYHAIEVAPRQATHAKFLSGDRRFVTVNPDGQIQLWDAQTLGLLATWP